MAGTSIELAARGRHPRRGGRLARPSLSGAPCPPPPRAGAPATRLPTPRHTELGLHWHLLPFRVAGQAEAVGASAPRMPLCGRPCNFLTEPPP